MKLSEVIRRTVELAKEMNAENRAWQSLLPPGSNILTDIELEPPNKTEETLKAFLLQQPVAVIYTVTAIMYLGRDHIPATEFDDHYDSIRDTFESPNNAIGQMLSKTPLPAYLERALKQFEDANLDIDSPKLIK